jgi:uncharacterized protein
MKLEQQPFIFCTGDLLGDTVFYDNGNCACPTDGFSLELETPKTIESTFVLAEAHASVLAKDFFLAFNPLGESGVVVLDQAAWSLLQAFRQPQPLAVAVNQAGDPPGGLTAARHLVEVGLLDPVGGRRKPSRSQPKTLTAWLHITNACNLRCPYCYLHKTPEEMDTDCGQRAVAAVFRSATAQGFHRVKLKYAGGEATLNFHRLLALHDYALEIAGRSNVELAGVVLSNGIALSDRMITELEARRIQLMISLDGVGEFHDVQRPFANGQGSFAHVERALDRLAKHQLKPCISITVSNRNLSGLAQTVSYVLDRELPFTINFYRENECSASFVDLGYQDEQIIAAMKEAFAVIEQKLPPYSLLGALVDRARLDAPHDKPCGVGDSYLVIDQQGRVAKCQMEIEQTVTDISADDPLRVIQASRSRWQNLPVEEKEGCRDCEWRYWCAGGCPALTYRVTGRFDVKSPNCRIYKALFPEVLRLEGLRLLKYSGVQVA